MVAYNERILETSQSPQRRHRAARMLVNLQPWVTHLERAAAEQVSTITHVEPAPKEDDEFEVVWNGGPLTTWPGDREA